jgi:lipopolysaccharide cholinephosphotransferase
MDNNLKKAQNIMLEILIEVDKICKKHNINYWLDSGTLLGAIRHKGFIPWDDDLDISMSIDDYYKFIKIAQDELPTSMQLQTKEIEKDFPYDFAKIRDNRGKIIEQHEKNKNVTYNQGIFIDIIPVIFIKDSFFYKTLYKFNFLAIKLFSYKYLNINKIRQLLIRLHDKMHSFNNKIVIRSGKFPSYLLYINKELIFPLKKIEFENYNFYIPNKAEEYLKSLYGNNFMQLPPKEKQHTHAFKIEIFKEKK